MEAGTNYSSQKDNSSHWRTKNFAQLEEQEQESATQLKTIGLFRRCLLSLSVNAEGHDAGLDRRLAELRERLRKQNSADNLQPCLDAIEQGLEASEKQTRAQLAALRKQLQACIRLTLCQIGDSHTSKRFED